MITARLRLSGPFWFADRAQHGEPSSKWISQDLVHSVLTHAALSLVNIYIEIFQRRSAESTPA